LITSQPWVSRCLFILMFATMSQPGVASPGQGGNPAGVESQRALVNDYCAYCHDDSLKEGGFSWSEVDVEHPDRNAPQAEEVIRKLRSGMMPPAGAPRPDESALRELAAALETRVDLAAANSPNISAPDLHRVNRKEYRNSIRDLLGIDVEVSTLLPPDGRTGGYDNMSEALTVTPALMQAYVRAADTIARLAVGDPDAAVAVKQYDVPKVVNQMGHVEGTPFGTRGGIGLVHNFPADGDYTFRMQLWYVDTGDLIGRELPESLQYQELEISIDGERVAVFTVDPMMNELTDGIMVTGPIAIKAGGHRVAAAFVSRYEGSGEDPYRVTDQTLVDLDYGRNSGTSLPPHLRTFTVTGPLKVTGVSDTASRRKIFTCRPADPAGEEPCARSIITELTAQAFRRPTTAEDLEALMLMYEMGREMGDFDVGVRTAVQTLIAMPEFVFRFERVPDDLEPGESFQISDLELASRLSYFLWNSAPDAELLDLASRDSLSENLEQQVGRMIADPRSRTLATNFAMQWLRLTGIEDVHPEGGLFPDFTKNLATSMKREVELLFDTIVREDRDVLELITADYTFVDETLAAHYGIPDISGNRFQRVDLEDPNRFGLLGKGAVLTVTSLSNRTSPVARGKYVLEVLVGSPPPLPPPVVPPFEESVNNETVRTVRQRMEAHRANPVCNACHKIMDPIGLTLENFDAIGRQRSTDGGFQIDPSSEMYDGTSLAGGNSLSRAILGRSDAFLGTFTQNILSYALGRVLDYRDMPTVRSIAGRAGEEDNRFSAFIMNIVTSAPFQLRQESPTSALEAGRR
jgi:hypothetical protein